MPDLLFHDGVHEPNKATSECNQDKSPLNSSTNNHPTDQCPTKTKACPSGSTSAPFLRQLSYIPNSVNSVYYEYHSYLNSSTTSSIAIATNFFDSIEELNEFGMPDLNPVDIQNLVQLFQLDSSPEVSARISILLQMLSEDAHTVQEQMKVLIGKGKMEVQMIALACSNLKSHGNVLDRTAPGKLLAQFSSTLDQLATLALQTSGIIEGSLKQSSVLRELLEMQRMFLRQTLKSSAVFKMIQRKFFVNTEAQILGHQVILAIGHVQKLSKFMYDSRSLLRLYAGNVNSLSVSSLYL
ncbi:hypothetical protein PGT21_013371 [Puccinia graminis f. sp. tritici]|uniref:Uncharacterized protein n=1 Tax=Puccinia graminis f. sp. tritici TaxID=56615 RepID=A0A5B0MR23_PUCGR|nr:hypothetical protein PGT21_013371 [Puccinia graminis f. sp. tritici]